MTARPMTALSASDRRIERSRRSLELLLETFFRPGDWAARLSYQAGLQGRLRTVEHMIDLGRLAADPSRAPLRLAFASDFHAGATTDPRMLAAACDALAAFEPDVLLLGGDFVSVRASYVNRLAPRLAAINPPLGKFAVLGNHDLRANHALVTAALVGAGVRMLTNTYHALPQPFEDITLCGLDDATRGDPRPDLSLDAATGKGKRIVLMHSPEGLKAMGERPFDLALCGHTHGGQVVLPWGTPLFVPGGHLNRRYHAGEFELSNGRRLLVSNGVGCSTIPLRVFAAPEVHLCFIV
jgi:predicted MPP superfamily phosphohydrolase